jgi:DNA repair photolyase
MGWTHEAKLIEKEFNTKLGKGNFIFIGSSTDMWGQWIRDDEIFRVLAYCRSFEENKYLFQTKNPSRFKNFASFLPEKTWLCTTIETNRDMKEISTAQSAYKRALEMAKMKCTGYKTTLTIEPIIDFDFKPMIEIIEAIKPDWISIGADSKGAGLDEPPVEKAKELIDELSRKKIDIIIKDNFKRLLFKKAK